MSTEQLAASVAEADRAALARVSALPLADFRDEHLATQLRRALASEGVGDAAALARRLAADPTALTRFRRSIAVSVTGRFRDPHQFELLERELLPPLLQQPGAIRVWSAGCSDGSELISLGLLLERLGALERTQLLGSDLLEENLRRAHEVDTALSEQLRARLRWEQRDLLAGSAPGGGWQLILCRNVAIYFTAPARARLERLLADALAPGGVLLLGRAERLRDPRALGLQPAGPHAYRRSA
ncbi:CheR family methyltransferase [Conexibacter sp. JD483]|uniref:CheR family methyltransferase n=1 Tax=unclassified Conexibacter TaxID=2627773 RepID=UPI002719629E|nr:MULTISPECIES: CheR family methyltransferase [unclassified Conexibacter]MDO8184041.1 CheR family methyltransferase [Conexibacter sp. CPCC 205706]MDO8197033.1 CheR family methyltransferase [Conexibacter sp. CPCC 205762]MDR9367949.1 CheR family methyltransferase [Conexibacter sp. JD483]